MEKTRGGVPQEYTQGLGDSSNDIGQGGSGDCYYLAAIAALSENEQRLDYNFVTKEVNPTGLYAFNVWVRGVPNIMSVDD